MAFPLGNLSALRTFRVLRALKTVAVVPGNLLDSDVTIDVTPPISAALSRDEIAYATATGRAAAQWYKT